VVGLLWGRTHLSAVQPRGVLHQVGKAFTLQQGWCGPQCVQLLWGHTHLSAVQPLGVLHQVGKAFTWQQGWCRRQCGWVVVGSYPPVCSPTAGRAAPGGQGFHTAAGVV
jgi:hypothetical protein